MKKIVYWSAMALFLALITHAAFAAEKIRAASGGSGTAIKQQG